MKNLKNTAFYLGIALLLTHEMDTMPNHEWRVLPVVRSLSESAGEVTFLLAHVSIFALLIAFIASLNHRVRRLARNLTCAFSIVHAGLHYAFSGIDAYEFSVLHSSALIDRAAACGVAFFTANIWAPLPTSNELTNQ